MLSRDCWHNERRNRGRRDERRPSAPRHRNWWLGRSAADDRNCTGPARSPYVYDSPSGQTLLIPQGSRLIGANDNVVSFGQKRALIVWRRLILPDGSSIQLDNWPAADKSGYTGLTDQVDGHSWQLIKGVALSTLLGVGTELSYGSSDSDLARALRQSDETGTSRAGDQLVGKSLDIQPTIRVRPGWPVRVVVHQDLLLKPWHPQLGGAP